MPLEQPIEGEFTEVSPEQETSQEQAEPKKYIGMTAIKKFERDEERNLVGALLEDNRQFSLSLRQFDAMVSDTPYADNLIEKKRWVPLVKEILTQMLDDQATVGDKETILALLDDSIVENYNTAVSKLFGVKYPTFTLLSQIDAVLKQE